MTVVALTFLGTALAGPASFAVGRNAKESRNSVLARAKVWNPVDTPSLDLKAGPAGPGSFGLRDTIACDYVNKHLPGATPKFA
jgi:hypothetical protein